MKTILRTCLLLVTFVGATTFAAVKPFPEVIALPDSWGPEGIATGRGTDFFAGARQGSPFQGAIYKGDLRTGEGDILVPAQPGRFALGLKLDQRTNQLFVAGGPSGSGYIYDATTGEDVAVFQFTTTPSFVNDVVVTRDAAYFTDSLNPVIYVVPLGPGGKIPAQPSFTALPLTGDYQQVTGFNVNGIVATPDGDSLIVVQSSTGLLYRVDPLTGIAEIDRSRRGVGHERGRPLVGRPNAVCGAQSAQPDRRGGVGSHADHGRVRRGHHESVF